MENPAIIFDFGNVIAYFDFQRAIDRLAGHLEIEPALLMQRLKDRGWDRLHRELEHGRLSAGQFAEQLVGLMERQVAHAAFVAAWCDIFTPNESIVPVVESLKRQNYRLILGSNTNAIHADHFSHAYASVLSQFDRLILSHEVGAMKPDRQFYDACVAAAGCPAAECIFIDDLADNVAGARKAGLQAVLYESTPGLIRCLADLGVTICTER